MEVAFLGYKIGPNPFDPEKEIAFYKLMVNQDGQDVAKMFKSASGRAARFFDEIKIGTRITMTRHGTGSNTKYEFSVVGADHTEQASESEESDAV